MKSFFVHAFSILSFAFIFSACGGGGSDGGKSTSVATLQSIEITPPAQNVTTGEAQKFTATGIYSDSTSRDISPQVSWLSSNTTVATINSAGLAISIAAGTTTITATLGSISRTAVLTASPPRTERITKWLGEGNFWMISWSEVEYETVFLGSPSYSGDFGSYTMKLGPPIVIDGIKMFEIQLDGDVKKLTPRWSRIGADKYGDIYGVMPNSQIPVLLYSPELTSWPGSGFYTKFDANSRLPVNRSASIIPSKYTNGKPYFNPPLTAIGTSSNYQTSSGGTGCEYFAEYGTICGAGPGGGATTAQAQLEFWHTDAGPVAMHDAYDYQDCLGFACTGKHKEQRIEVWSFIDTSTGYIRHNNEPDSFTQPTVITLSGTGSWMSGEVYQTEAKSSGNSNWSAHDWYAFNVTAARNVSIRLFWGEDGTNFNIELYTAPDSLYGFMHLDSGKSYNDPDFKYAKIIDGMFQPGKYMLGVTRTTTSKFGSGYSILSYLY